MDISDQSNLAKVERKQFTGIALRAMKLLGQGILPEEVARALGVDASYISQLKNDPDFTSQVNELVQEAFSAQSEIDENYVKAEKILSKRLLESANVMYQPDMILRSLGFLNKAQKKLPPSQLQDGHSVGGNNGGRAPILLVMPAPMIREFTLNPTNEIVGIGDTPLTTLPSGNINKLVADFKAKEKEQKATLKLEHKNGTRSEDPWGDL